MVLAGYLTLLYWINSLHPHRSLEMDSVPVCMSVSAHMSVHCIYACAFVCVCVYM